MRNLFSLTTFRMLAAGFAFLILGTLSSANAQIQFVLTATANDSSQGYIDGNTYTFVLTTGSTFGSNPSSFFDGSSNSWIETESSEDQLWTAVTGSGVSGTFVRPSDPYSNLFNADGEVFLLLSTESPDPTGLLVADGSGLRDIVTDIFSGDFPTFTFSGSYEDPIDYFTNYFGTYSGDSSTVIVDGESGTTQFSLTSVTISAVPEPSTWALMLVALVGLGAAARFKTKRA